jgi:uncharacterized protein YndB with AHSA1/START domain
MTSMTSNQPSVVDQDALSVRRTILISAPVEKVWSAVTEPEHISRWFGRASFDGAGVGTRGTLTFGDRRIPLRVEAMVEPTTVTYRWGNDDALAVLPDEVDDEHSTVFTFTLDPVEGGTRLTVVETGFETTSAPAENLEDHRGGWDSELDKLIALFGGGS